MSARDAYDRAIEHGAAAAAWHAIADGLDAAATRATHLTAEQRRALRDRADDARARGDRAEAA